MFSGKKLFFNNLYKLKKVKIIFIAFQIELPINFFNYQNYTSTYRKNK